MNAMMEKMAKDVVAQVGIDRNSKGATSTK